MRISDYGAENLHSIIQNMAYRGRNNPNTPPLVVADLFRAANADMPEYNSYAWACYYGVENSSQPDGEIFFSVNGQGYVSTLKVISYSNQTVNTTSYVMAMCLVSLGLSEQEIDSLLKNFEGSDVIKMSRVWSNAQNKNFLLTLTPRVVSNEGFQFLIMATD